MNKISLNLIVINLVISCILIFVPQIDIAFSSLFYDQDSNGFFLRNLPIFIAIHKGVKIATLITAITLVILAIVNIERKAVLLMILTMAIGPGLAVHTLLKDNFGRARPNRIVEFSGDKNFTPAWKAANNCVKNCSFVSGHAAIGFWTSAFAFLTNNYKRRKTIVIAAIIIGSILGLVRIAMGGHFLSDIYFAAVIVLSINYLTEKTFKR